MVLYYLSYLSAHYRILSFFPEMDINNWGVEVCSKKLELPETLHIVLYYLVVKLITEILSITLVDNNNTTVYTTY